MPPQHRGDRALGQPSASSRGAKPSVDMVVGAASGTVEAAARRATSVPELDYLARRLARLRAGGHRGPGG